MSKSIVISKMYKLQFSNRFISNYFEECPSFNDRQEIKTCYRDTNNTRLIFIDSKILTHSDDTEVRRFFVKEINSKDQCLSPDELKNDTCFDSLKEAQQEIIKMIPNLIKMV